MLITNMLCNLWCAGDGDTKKKRGMKKVREESSEHTWVDILQERADHAGLNILEYCQSVRLNANNFSEDDWSLARRYPNSQVNQ